MFEQVMDEAALARGLETSPFLLLKHSPRCIVCDWAYDALLKFASRNSEIVCGWLDVATCRPLSDLIVERTGIAHQSPQIFLFVDGEVRWTEAFSKINFAGIEEAMEGLV